MHDLTTRPISVDLPPTTLIPKLDGRPLLPAPCGGVATYDTRAPLRRLFDRLLALVATVFAAVLDPETSNPRPHAGYVGGTVIACALITAYAIAGLISGGAR